jgi:3-dehydroquinate dehydratase I
MNAIAREGFFMRLTASKPFDIRGRVIGGPKPLICLPLAAADLPGVISQARAAVALAPDLIEWRADAFEDLHPSNLARILSELQAAIGDVPLIFTCRRVEEGGFRAVDDGLRLRINLAAVASERIDLLDTELAGGESFIATVGEACRRAGIRLILSWHDFQHTPAATAIVDRLARAEALGADIAKAAVMPVDGDDVFTLLDATRLARRGAVKIPLITMAMGGKGLVSRIVGPVYGSDVAFAVGVQATAPGQVPIEKLREVWRVLGVQS